MSVNTTSKEKKNLNVKKSNLSKSSDDQLKIVFILFLTAGIFIYLALQNEDQKMFSNDSSSLNPNSPMTSKISDTENFNNSNVKNDLTLVNKYLKKEAQDIEFKKLQNLAENIKAQKILNDPQTLNNLSKSKGTNSASPQDDESFFNFEGDPRVRQLAEDVGRVHDQYEVSATDPKSKVYESLIDDRFLHDRTEEEKKLQAEQFIENARKDGWIVQLDPSTYKIKSYKRASKSSNDHNKSNSDNEFKGYELFPSSPSK